MTSDCPYRKGIGHTPRIPPRVRLLTLPTCAVDVRRRNRGAGGESSAAAPRVPVTMPRPTSVFVCSACGSESAKWHGRCPGCGAWNTLAEEARGAAGPAKRARRGPGGPAGAARRGRGAPPRAAADRHQGARPDPRRRPGAGLAGADRRLAGDREVDADDDGARQPAGRRPADAVRVGRGVGRPDPPARGAAAGRRARRPGAGGDGPRDRARDARRRAPRGLRGRLGADAARARPDRRGRLGRAGARGRRPDHPARQGARDRGAARRSRDQGGVAGRPARARAPRRLRAAVRRRARADLSHAARPQEPLRLHQRRGRVRDAVRRVWSRSPTRRRGSSARRRAPPGVPCSPPWRARDRCWSRSRRWSRPRSWCRRDGSRTGSTATASRSCSRSSPATPASAWGRPTCSSTSPAACGSTSREPTSRSPSPSRARTAGPARRRRLPRAVGRRTRLGAAPLGCFGEVGLTGELRSVAHPDRRLAEAAKFGLQPGDRPARQRSHRGADPDGTALRAAAPEARCARRMNAY